MFTDGVRSQGDRAPARHIHQWTALFLPVKCAECIIKGHIPFLFYLKQLTGTLLE